MRILLLCLLLIPNVCFANFGQSHFGDVNGSSSNNSGNGNIVSTDQGVPYSSGANHLITTASDLYYDYTNKILHAPSFQTSPSNTPQIQLFPTQVNDTHWIIGVQADGLNTSNDSLIISQGTNFNTNNVMTIFPNSLGTTANVGIGSNAPGVALDVNGGVRSTAITLNLAPLASGNVLVSNGVGVGTWMPPSTIGAGGGGSGTITSSTANQIGRFTGATTIAGTSNMVSDGTNIGVGTTLPTRAGSGTEVDIVNTASAAGTSAYIMSTLGPAALILAGDTTIKTPFINFDNNHSLSDVTVGNIALDRTSVVMAGDVQNDFIFYTSSGAGTSLRLGTEGVARLSVNSGGNIGIGTGTAPQNLYVVGTTQTTTAFKAAGNLGISSTCPNSHIVQVTGGLITSCY